MVCDTMIEKALFNKRVTQYNLWYQTPEGKYVDTLEQVLFLKQSLLDVGWH